MDSFSHVDSTGRARMVDVNPKTPQLRIARASGRIAMAEATASLIAENNIKKGDVLTVAEITGIQAVKKTFDLIPLCHLVHIGGIQVSARLEKDGVLVTSEVSCVDRTGVEMEALTAVSVALLAVYDMCKAVDKKMTIGDITLIEKIKKDIE